MKIYINDGIPVKGIPTKRKLIEVKLIKEFPATLLVRLPDGSEILRKKSRDLPKEDK